MTEITQAIAHSNVIQAPSPQRTNESDYSTIASLQHRMEKLLDDLDRQAPAYANARQITEFSGDRKKTALAEAFCSIRAGDPEESAAAAEHRARASAGFKEAMKRLIHDELNAQTAIANYHVLQTRLDVARGFLAIERAKIERAL